MYKAIQIFFCYVRVNIILRYWKDGEIITPTFHLNSHQFMPFCKIKKSLEEKTEFMKNNKLAVVLKNFSLDMTIERENNFLVIL